MPERPAIPAEITRQILIESGHRCAACGANCPLERAHIIPWHKSKEHKVEDLICLCASCHERADLELWGEKTLREYKRNPWILRQYNDKSASASVARIQVIIDMELSQFDDTNRRVLQYALAGFLSIPPDSIKVISEEESNSVKITLEMPSESADQLLEAYQRNDSRLIDSLNQFIVLKICRPSDTSGQQTIGLKDEKTYFNNLESNNHPSEKTLMEDLITKQLHEDYLFARKEAKTRYIVSFAISVTSSLIIIAGGVLALNGNALMGAISSTSGLALEIISYLLFLRLDTAHRRLDKYHEELLQSKQLEALLAACYQIEDQESKELCLARVIQVAVESWATKRSTQDVHPQMRVD